MEPTRVVPSVHCQTSTGYEQHATQEDLGDRTGAAHQALRKLRGSEHERGLIGRARSAGLRSRRPLEGTERAQCARRVGSRESLRSEQSTMISISNSDGNGKKMSQSARVASVTGLQEQAPSDSEAGPVWLLTGQLVCEHTQRREREITRHARFQGIWIETNRNVRRRRFQWSI